MSVVVEGNASTLLLPNNTQTEFAPTLRNISLAIPKGSLTVIVGAVGSGKSSLLCGLLGEMKRQKGSIVLSGSIGYCPQHAWIQNASVKENVLFGRTYDKQRYEQAIKVAALTKDLEVSTNAFDALLLCDVVLRVYALTQILPDGDETEIGER